MSLHQIRIEAFKNQDQEVGDFNVTFLIDGKKLLANKFMLMPVSTTFASMLSERWTSKDDPIPIETYGYDDFYQFITFIYSEECLLSDDNILTMVDIAEFFQVGLFKDYCKEYLKRVEWTSQNVFQILETSIKYSIVKLTKSLVKSIRLNYCNSVEFLGITKELLLSILEADQSKIANDEEMLEKVYQWAEKRAKTKKAFDLNLKLDETIKEDMLDFMPFFDFEEMDHRFFTEFFFGKSLLLSGTKMKSIISKLDSSTPKVIVKIIDQDGRIMKGRFFDTENAYADIQSLAKQQCRFDEDNEDACYYWKTARTRIPNDPHLFIENDVKWCLTYDRYGRIRVKKFLSTLYPWDVYLIAEMFPEKQFELSEKCKIVVIRL